MNRRSGRFERVQENPLKGVDFNSREWICYPAKVGELVILIYFHYSFAELVTRFVIYFRWPRTMTLRARLMPFMPMVCRRGVARFSSSQVFYEDDKAGMLLGCAAKGWIRLFWLSEENGFDAA